MPPPIIFSPAPIHHYSSSGLEYMNHDPTLNNIFMGISLILLFFVILMFIFTIPLILKDIIPSIIQEWKEWIFKDKK